MGLSLQETTLDSVQSLVERSNIDLTPGDTAANRISTFLQSLVGDPDFHCFATVDDSGMQVGYITVVPYKDEIAAIGPMFVCPEYRGQNIGRTQVLLLIEWARAAIYKGVYTKTWSANVGARRIFESLGFELSGEIPNDRPDGDTTIKYQLMFKEPRVA